MAVTPYKAETCPFQRRGAFWLESGYYASDDQKFDSFLSCAIHEQELIAQGKTSVCRLEQYDPAVFGAADKRNVYRDGFGVNHASKLDCILAQQKLLADAVSRKQADAARASSMTKKILVGVALGGVIAIITSTVLKRV